jgi:hypothetical protein
MSNEVYVRVIPTDPARGFKVKRYNFRGFTFRADAGWYKVQPELAAELKKCVQNVNAPDPKPVFQVGTEKEALELVKVEFEKQNPEMKIQSAIASARVVNLKAPEAKDRKKPGEDEEETPFGN